MGCEEIDYVQVFKELKSHFSLQQGIINIYHDTPSHHKEECIYYDEEDYTMMKEQDITIRTEVP